MLIGILAVPVLIIGLSVVVWRSRRRIRAERTRLYWKNKPCSAKGCERVHTTIVDTAKLITVSPGGIDRFGTMRHACANPAHEAEVVASMTGIDLRVYPTYH